MQEKQQQECALANKAALVKLGILESLLALAVGSGGIPSCPVRTQVPLTCVNLCAMSLAVPMSVVKGDWVYKLSHPV